MPFVILETTSVNHELGKFFHPLGAKFRTSKNPGCFAQLGDLRESEGEPPRWFREQHQLDQPGQQERNSLRWGNLPDDGDMGDYRSPTKYSVIKVNVIKSMYIGSS